jgi:hypothetical protein
VFYCYDAMVERRQQTVLESATRSSAIVSSLFPSAVRDRLYPIESKPTAKTNKLDAFIPETAKDKLQSFLRDGKDTSNATPTMGQESPFGGSPIAELYPDTTVLFADIAGFTVSQLEVCMSVDSTRKSRLTGTHFTLHGLRPGLRLGHQPK